jgi:hypothetical protein
MKLFLPVLILMLIFCSFGHATATEPFRIDGFVFRVKADPDSTGRPLEVTVSNGKALAYGLLPSSSLSYMNGLSYFKGGEFLPKLKTAFIDTSPIDARNGLAQKALDLVTDKFLTNTTMNVSNFDSELGSKIQNDQYISKDFMLYTDLSFEPFSLPTVLNYGNVLSIVMDMKVSGKTPSLVQQSKLANFYNKFIITPEKKKRLDKIFNAFDVITGMAELSAYIFADDETQLEISQAVGNARSLIGSMQTILNAMVPQQPVTTGSLRDTTTDVVVESIKNESPFLGGLIEVAVNYNNVETDNLNRRWALMEILNRKFYALGIDADPQLATLMTEDEFAYTLKQFMQWKYDSTKFKITQKDMQNLKELRTVVLRSSALKQLFSAFGKSMSGCLNIVISPVNTINNMMNSLTNDFNKEDIYNQLLDGFVREYLFTQFESAASGAIKNSIISLAKTLMPGYRVAAAFNDLGAVAVDAATAPKYVPINVAYDPGMKSDPVTHGLLFTGPKSVDYSMHSYIEDVTDNEISPESSAYRHKVVDILLDIDQANKECFAGWGCRYYVSNKPALLMKPNPVFYQQFYLGVAGISSGSLTNAVAKNPIVKVGIDVSSENKGTLLDAINLPKQKMDVTGYVAEQTIMGKTYSAIDFKRMFKDSKNAWYLGLLSRENKTYLKLQGASDVYDLRAVIDFNDKSWSTQNQPLTGAGSVSEVTPSAGSDTRGSLFESTQRVFIAQGLGAVKSVIAPWVYYSPLSATSVRLEVNNKTNNILHYYLYDDANHISELLKPDGATYAGVQPLETASLYITTPSEWVANHLISKKIIAFEDKVYRYLSTVYGGNEEAIAAAVKRIITDQGANEYVVVYDGSSLKYEEGSVPRQQTLDDLQDNSTINANFDGKPYFEVQVADVDAAAFDAQHQVFTTALGDKIRIYPRNDPSHTDFSTLTGTIQAVFEDFTNGMVFSSGTRPTLVKPTGIVASDGGIEVTMPAGTYRLRYISGTTLITYAQFLVTEKSFLTTGSVNANGLVAHWSFDDCTATDVSGNGHDGTIFGKPPCVSGVFGKSLQFVGNYADYVSIPDSPNFKFSNSFSISLWLNSNNYGNVMSKGRDINSHFQIAGGGNNFSLNYTDNYTDSVSVSDNSYAFNNWNYITIVADNLNKQLKYYKNSTLIDKKIITKDFNISTDFPLVFGRHFTCAAGGCGYEYPFSGIIDEVYVMNYPLSDTEIKALYANGFNDFLKKLPVATFFSENLPDGTYQVGTATKTWRFKSGANAITGLKAVQVSGKTDSGLGIIQTEIAIGDVAANTEFLVNLPIIPSHDGVYMKSSYWTMVDANGQAVTITNSKTGQFWLKLRTNHRPRLSPIQLYGMSGMAGNTMTMKIIGIDDDADPLTYAVNGINATVDNTTGILTATIAAAGVYDFTVTISDGMESVTGKFQAVVANGYQTGRIFADVPDDGLPSRDSLYANIHYLAMLGVVNGVYNTQTGERLFNPDQVTSQSEALAMIMKAAEKRGFISLDCQERYLKNLIKEDYTTGEFYNYTWATPYVLKAEQMGIIPVADTFDPTVAVTRKWLARALVKLLKLEVPLDAIVHPENYQFTDSASFDTATTDYDNARAVAFFNYMGQLGANFNPAAESMRKDVALIASRIIRTPTMDNASYSGLSSMVIKRKSLPSLVHGQTFAVTGINNPQSRQILKAGETIQENWIGSDGDYVTAMVVKTGVGIVESKLAKLYTVDTPVIVTTAQPDITASEERSILVILEDSDSGVLSTWRLSYGVVVPDADGDGVPDSLDLWPGYALFSSDSNANGIPDNADTLWNLSARNGSQTVNINGTSMTLIDAVLNNALANDTTAPTTTVTTSGNATVTLTVNETATIYYTTDGSTPSSSSPQYTSPLSLAAGTKLAFFAIDLAGNSEASQTVTIATTKPGDCDSNSAVTIAEVQSAINMFLGLKPVEACVNQDLSSGVSIAEVQKVINSFLGL